MESLRHADGAVLLENNEEILNYIKLGKLVKVENNYELKINR